MESALLTNDFDSISEYKKPLLFGAKIRRLRVERKMVQRELAEQLNIDTPMFSKIELGVRRAKRSQVVQLAKLLHVNEKELLTLWLADSVLNAVKDDRELGLAALKVAKKTIMP